MTKENEAIQLRPHHGLCLLNFRGAGYSDDFSRNMAAMQKRLQENPETAVRVTKGCDELCGRCPHREGSDCSSEHPPLFDGNVLKLTGIAYGQKLSWRELKERTTPLSLHHLEEACPDCQWLSLCRKIAAERLKEENGSGLFIS